MSERINKGRKRNIVDKKGTIERSSETTSQKVGNTFSFLARLFKGKKKVKEDE